MKYIVLFFIVNLKSHKFLFYFFRLLYTSDLPQLLYAVESKLLYDTIGERIKRDTFFLLSICYCNDIDKKLLRAKKRN